MSPTKTQKHHVQNNIITNYQWYCSISKLVCPFPEGIRYGTNILGAYVTQSVALSARPPERRFYKERGLQPSNARWQLIPKSPQRLHGAAESDAFVFTCMLSWTTGKTPETSQSDQNRAYRS